MRTLNVLKTLALLAPLCANGQVEIDYTVKLKSFPTSGIISMVEDSTILTCGAPDTIEYLECGAGATLLPSGDCRVNAGQTFAVSYKVNDVESCTGSGGTPSWQGTLAPFAGGSGTFSKNITGGIAATTDFTLNCTPQPTVHEYGKIAKHVALDLNSIWETVNNLVHENKLASYNLLSGQIELVA